MGMTDDYDQSLDSYLSYYVAIEAMRVAYEKGREKDPPARRPGDEFREARPQGA